MRTLLSHFSSPSRNSLKTKPKTNKQVKTNKQNPSCGSQNFLIFNLSPSCYCRMFLCHKSKLTYFNIKVYFEVGKVKTPLHLYYYYYKRKRFINTEINLIEIKKFKGFSNMSIEHGNEPSWTMMLLFLSSRPPKISAVKILEKLTLS